MANKRHRPSDTLQGATPGSKVPKKDSLNESTPNWPGLPGKEGPERSNDTKKLNIHPQQKGL